MRQTGVVVQPNIIQTILSLQASLVTPASSSSTLATKANATAQKFWETRKNLGTNLIKLFSYN